MFGGGGMPGRVGYMRPGQDQYFRDGGYLERSWTGRQSENLLNGANGAFMPHDSLTASGYQRVSNSLGQTGQNILNGFPRAQQETMRSPLRVINQSSSPTRRQDPAHLEKLQKQEMLRRDLDEQIKLKQIRKDKEKIERKREQAEELKQALSYNPWGRSGYGAPWRDSQGEVLADLRHLDNGQILALGQSQVQSPQRPLLNVPHLALQQKHDEKNWSTPGSPYSQTQQPQESARFTRFRFGSVSPEEQERLNEKARKQNEAKQLLESQMADKRRRQEAEKRRQQEEDRLEEERLARERNELQEAYDREKGRLANKVAAQEQYKMELDKQREEQQLRKRQEEDERKRREVANMGLQSPVSSPHFSPQHRLQQLSLQSPKHPNLIPSSPPQKNYFPTSSGESLQVANQIGQYKIAASLASGSAMLDMVPARLAQLRQELLGEHDSLRRQIRRQEDTLRDLRDEVTRMQSLGEKVSRRRQFIQNEQEKVELKSNSADYVKYSTSSNHHSNSSGLQSKSLFLPANGGLDPVDVMMQATLPTHQQNRIEDTSPSTSSAATSTAFQPRPPIPQVVPPRHLQSVTNTQEDRAESTEELDTLLRDFLSGF